MKYLLSIFVFFIHLSAVNASELTEYEDHYQDMNRLKDELAQLELKKKIQMVENEIYASKQSLQDSKNKKINNETMEREIKSNSGFDPNEAKLLYIVGSGKNKKAVISFNEITKTVYNGSLYYGWKVKIRNKEVSIMKGKEVIKL